jgi:hypothetical protein
LSRTTSVGRILSWERILADQPGLISQVAEELWEVKDKTVKNLTKEDITIVDYKKALAKRSEIHAYHLIRDSR